MKNLSIDPPLTPKITIFKAKKNIIKKYISTIRIKNLKPKNTTNNTSTLQNLINNTLKPIKHLLN